MGKKVVRQNENVKGCKKPKAGEQADSYLGLNPSWRLNKLDVGGRWGELTNSVIDKLKNFETMTWDEISKITHDNAKSSNHFVDISKLAPRAVKRIYELHLEDYSDQFYSLHFSNRERVYGILDNGIFSVIWCDKNHEIYVCKKKNT